jgi:hypothetical protein
MLHGGWPGRVLTAMPKHGFVTGDKELDRILATFEPKEVLAAIRKATRATIKPVGSVVRLMIHEIK